MNPARDKWRSKPWASKTGVLTFRRRLLAWYDAHARELPWRGSRDPYRIWLSEIMLQQTRVAAVIEYYHEFLRRFPTVQKLAAAREASVLAAWSGLGYYRRARMLYAAAKVIARDLGGQFPTTAEQWQVLPGIGRYTAAAIASIASDEPVAVVDGNVERVLQRISGQRLSGEELWTRACELLDRQRPGDFNQAMMELGATVCTPRAPACSTCPVVKLCATRGEMPGSPKFPRQKKREIHYALHQQNGAVFLAQRPWSVGLMPGMWELPEILAAARSCCHSDPPVAASAARAREESAFGFTLRHSITVTNYTVRVWRQPAPKGVQGKWVSIERLDQVALTGLARKILRKAGVLHQGRD